MTKTGVKNEYFKWMYQLVYDRKYAGGLSYKKLLRFLNEKEFTYILPMDENRANDGVTLRYRFIREYGYNRMDLEYLDEKPCSVLEMMVALSLRCEENIMYDPDIGNRTGRWFWDMISNLNLEDMSDSNFDEKYTNYILDRFLNRAYKRNGEGNLFRISLPGEDLRSVEIWYQMCWYLDSVNCLNV